MGHPRRQAKSTFCMHCPGSGKRHWDGWACALFCLLRWRTGGCSLVYDEERPLCRFVLFTVFFVFLSFPLFERTMISASSGRFGEFRAWEASTMERPYEHNGFGGAYIFTTAIGSRAQRRRIRRNAAEKPRLGNFPTTAFTRGRPNRRSRMACQVPELSLCF